MIIDCHGHYTTEPKDLHRFRKEQTAAANAPALVMGIALHPYLVGQPYRLRHLRRALAHVAAARDRGQAWITTPGAICAHVDALAATAPGDFDGL